MTYVFPHNTVVVDKEGGVIEHHRGLDLRTYLAARAMQGMLSEPSLKASVQDFASKSYEIADAMMVAREK